MPSPVGFWWRIWASVRACFWASSSGVAATMMVVWSRMVSTNIFGESGAIWGCGWMIRSTASVALPRAWVWMRVLVFVWFSVGETMAAARVRRPWAAWVWPKISVMSANVLAGEAFSPTGEPVGAVWCEVIVLAWEAFSPTGKPVGAVGWVGRVARIWCFWARAVDRRSRTRTTAAFPGVWWFLGCVVW